MTAMTQDELLKQLVDELVRAKKPTSFCSSGTIDFGGATISIHGVGTLKLPMRTADVKKLSQVAVQAPYGKRTETIVDTAVRDTLEIPAELVTCSSQLVAALRTTVKNVAMALQLDYDRLQCELYKMLIYTKGGFFLPHRDSEKRSGMVASMIVVLPTKFNGGELLVEHEGRKHRFSFDAARQQLNAEYVAFFSDCQHEVKKVTSGVRICLAFNLMLQPESKSPKKSKDQKSDPKLLRTVEDWILHRAELPIVFALEHQYTSGGLSPSLLKGADAQLFEQLTYVAEEADCKLHFGQVSRHLCQYADDGSFGYGRRGYHRFSGDYSELEIGEVYDDEIVIDGWKDARGKPVRLANLLCESSQLIGAIPVEKWVPTKQDYEGYTGNAGNTLDRWYHKSAVILWPNSQHFEVIAQMGMQYAIEQFQKLIAKRETLKGDKQLRATGDCIKLAEVIIGRWPERGYHKIAANEELELLNRFAETLPTLESPKVIGDFLSTLAQRDQHFDLNKFVPIALKCLGSEVLLPLLRELIAFEQQPNKYGIVFVEGLTERNAAWLCKLYESPKHIESPALDQLLAIATEKIRKHVNQCDKVGNSRSTPPIDAWLLLCKTSLYSDNEQFLRELLKMPINFISIFDVRNVQVPASIKLREWSSKARTEMPQSLTEWIASIREWLQKATTTKPAPPVDLARQSDTGCNCQYCVQLSQFLSDREREHTDITAREDMRYHLENVIRTKQFDVTAVLNRSRRPYSLSLTKTSESYHRAVKQFEVDLKLLASLDLDYPAS